jgi:hypothetical protein
MEGWGEAGEGRYTCSYPVQPPRGDILLRMAKALEENFENAFKIKGPNLVSPYIQIVLEYTNKTVRNCPTNIHCVEEKEEAESCS